MGLFDNLFKKQDDSTEITSENRELRLQEEANEIAKASLLASNPDARAAYEMSQIKDEDVINDYGLPVTGADGKFVGFVPSEITNQYIKEPSTKAIQEAQAKIDALNQQVESEQFYNNINKVAPAAMRQLREEHPSVVTFLGNSGQDITELEFSTYLAQSPVYAHGLQLINTHPNIKTPHQKKVAMEQVLMDVAAEFISSKRQDTLVDSLADIPENPYVPENYASDNKELVTKLYIHPDKREYTEAGNPEYDNLMDQLNNEMYQQTIRQKREGTRALVDYVPESQKMDRIKYLQGKGHKVQLISVS